MLPQDRWESLLSHTRKGDQSLTGRTLSCRSRSATGIRVQVPDLVVPADEPENSRSARKRESVGSLPRLPLASRGRLAHIPDSVSLLSPRTTSGSSVGGSLIPGQGERTSCGAGATRPILERGSSVPCRWNIAARDGLAHRIRPGIRGFGMNRSQRWVAVAVKFAGFAAAL